METIINTVIKEGLAEVYNLREEFYAKTVPDQ